MTSYVASKHAVVGFTLALRAEAMQYGIKVNALCPVFIETPIHDAAPNLSGFLNSEKNTRPKNKYRMNDFWIGWTNFTLKTTNKTVGQNERVRSCYNFLGI
jgi:NAD(P)-dependent dehydrogenase (short-subunit alcohol dehydrogenase family)